MNNLAKKLHTRTQRKNRIRSTVTGTTERPRLSVFVSNLNITAQIIDDSKQVTLVAITTVGEKSVKGTMTEKAAWAGTEIAKKAKTAKVTKVVFDRGGRQYHGRVKALAEAARAGGLEF
ncbi:MAG: rplR [Candidatus Saccharibacteria bacterium]|nr:rplR [Candidatus Saccharibacteria bacterium]